jgi:hypothetical protein
VGVRDGVLPPSFTGSAAGLAGALTEFRVGSRPRRRRMGSVDFEGTRSLRSCGEEADAEREHTGREARGPGIEEENEPVGLGGAAAG